MKETQLNSQSLDIKEENIEKIQSLFPEVFKEGKVDFDLLKQILGEYVEDETERYNFTWNGKGQALRLSQTPSAGTLRPCKEESKDWDTTQNLYIEGDNLEVLKLLQKSYHSKVKMIYIDPPYNTGKDFVYPDNFRDTIDNYKRITGQVDDEGIRLSTNAETSGRYHTDWLNMMYPRLRLARNLLTDDGVIFISIDDNEVDNLKKICNEVFGEDNFITIAILQRSTNGMGDRKGFAKNHEFILCYQKSEQTDFRGLTPDNNYLSLFDKEDEYGKYKIDGILMKKGAGSRKQDSPTLFFPLFYSPITGKVSLIKKEGFIERYPIKSDGSEGRWIWGREKITNENYRLYSSPNGTIYVKDYLSEDRRMKIKSILIDSGYITDRATNEIKDIFDNKVFDTPKPIKLLTDLSDICTSTDDIILDFFSGSATTAHAVMQLNAEDGGNRKFIMIQLPEPTDEKSEAYKAGYKNICEIGKERIRRAGEKIKEEKGLLAQDLDIGFKVLKLDTSNIRKWQPDFDHLDDSLLGFMHHYVPNRTDFDMLYEIMIKYGLDLGRTVEEFEFAGKKFYSIGLGELFICLEDDISIELAKDILAKIKASKSECYRVVFKDNGFLSDADKTNVKEILNSGGIEEFITV
ncbi:MAG: site-specific DNA-methyltransferase [Candidatus Cloacimonadales bacterium]|jgi:adenine-specific DNA-methyltransferase|nr:site-specific DNA-methyltransferase [Candidatus Cloacimonadales bacterium]